MRVRCLCGNDWRKENWYNCKLCRCHGCGLVHTLTDDGAVYDADYFSHLEKSKGVDIGEWVAMRAGQMRRLTTGTRLLDVGTGSGDIAAGLQRAGYRVDVLDCELALDAILVRHSAGRFMMYSEWDEITGQYDVVHMAHVLEHVADPLDILDKCANVLKPNGVLWLQVPYELMLYSLYRLLGVRVDPCPEHLTFWNVALLRKALSKRFVVEAVFHDAPFARLRMAQGKQKVWELASCLIGRAPVITALARVKK